MFNTITARIHIGAQAAMDGERAFRDGVPYENAPQSELHNHMWRMGWKRAQRETSPNCDGDKTNG